MQTSEQQRESANTNPDEQIGEVVLWQGEPYTLRLMAHQSEAVYRQGRNEAIGDVTLWRDQRYSLRIKAHVADEVYRQARRKEIIPLKQQRGVRTYVHAKPYVLLPDIPLGVQLYPTPAPTGAVGEASSSTWRGMRHEEVGNCRSWYYIEDRTIILWESFLHERFRIDNPLDDANTYALWEGFERFLLARFPSARLIATTHDDPLYEREQYQDFLRSMGYTQLSEQAFGKEPRQQDAT